MKRIREFWHDTSGDMVVEATILFPIMIMIFAGLVLLAMYLPQRAMLQEAAQVAAVAIATERSDTWIEFNNNAVYRRAVLTAGDNVYLSAFRRPDGTKAESIVRNFATRGFVSAPGQIVVDYDIKNFVIYQEVIVTVTQNIPMPVNLLFIGFPDNITLTQEARAVVQNGDEFVRNIDIAKDMVLWLDNKFNVSGGLKGALDKAGDSVIRGIFGH